MTPHGQPLRIAILASGEGTTLQAVLDACASGVLNARVVVVISNRRDSGALRRAEAAKINGVYLSSRTHSEPAALDQAMAGYLTEAKVDLVVLAGFLKKIGPCVLAAFGERMLNTHPALLPKFGGEGMYGRHIHEAVLAAGEKETGVTVHRVDGDYDRGAVVAQLKVPVQKGDTVDSLATRVQAAERLFLVETLQQFAVSHTVNSEIEQIKP